MLVQAPTPTAPRADASDTPPWRDWFPELGSFDEVEALLRRTSGDAVLSRPEPARPAAGALALAPSDAARARGAEHDSVVAALAVAVLHDVEDDLVSALTPVRMLARNGLADDACAHLLGQLTRALAAPLAVELYRLRDAGVLAGDTSEARYRAFHGRVLGAVGTAELSARFPRLADDITRLCDRTVRAVGEIARHYAADRPRLCDELGVDPASRLTGIALGAGDSHRGGRSVAVLTHDDGHRVVYKPRSTELDTAFAAVLTWCNQHLDTAFPVCRYVGGSDHGFMEYLPSPIPAGDALPAYFDCAGGLLALLHALNGCDVHFENLRTMDGLPVVIDLETLLHTPQAEPDLAARFSPRAAVAAINDSVARIGMLPRVLPSTSGGTSVDVGALGYTSGAISPRRVHHLVDDGTDRMHLAFEHLTVTGDADVPTLAHDDSTDTLISAFTAGFTRTYQRLLAARPAFRALIADQFADRTLRYLNNETIFYGQLLQMSAHPELLGDFHGRELLLHRVALRHREQSPAVHRSELTDLLDGDIPYLTVSSSDTELRGSRGERLGEHLPVTPLAATLAKIDELGPADLDRQVRVISAAMLDKRGDDAVRTGLDFDGPAVATGSDRLATACDIGDFLLASMFGSDADDVPSDWISAVVAAEGDDEGWRAATLGFDLYAGRPGIALALAALAAVTGRHDFADAATSVVRPLVAILHPDHPLQGGGVTAGAFDGQAGGIRTLHRVGRLLGDADLVDAAHRGVPGLAGYIEADTRFDLVSGTAGVLATAIELHHHARDADDRARAMRIVGRAARRLDVDRDAVHRGGPGPSAGRDVRRSGYAHGVAGYYPWLYAAAQLLSGPDAAAAERGADHFLRQERALFDPRDRDWQRDDAQPDRRSYGWCHGAPGILLAKVLTLRERPDLAGEFAPEIERAVELTIAHGIGNNPTYCHGDLGNLEILGFAADVLADSELRGRVDAAFGRLHDTHLRHARHDLRSRHALSDGLMIGLAGTAYALARDTAPDQIGPVLW